jgi:hypothetical protein
MQPTWARLLNPPSVEGWHRRWINSGSLMSRINFVASQISNPTCRAFRRSSTA